MNARANPTAASEALAALENAQLRTLTELATSTALLLQAAEILRDLEQRLAQAAATPQDILAAASTILRTNFPTLATADAIDRLAATLRSREADARPNLV